MKVTLIAGARPNFMKIAPIIHAMDKAGFNGTDLSYRLVHTGQHFDRNMSDTFFEELNIPKPDVNLGINGGSQAEQTAGIMVAFEKELMDNPANLVLVVGDVTSTMACSIVAKKMGIKVAHVEAGIRSWDLSMPEEINRIVTDSITDYFFTTSVTANENLRHAGVKENCIFFVGNVMIDTLLSNILKLKKPSFFDTSNLKSGEYFVMTMHRPANVDEQDKLIRIIDEILTSVEGRNVIFPIHPRTAKIFKEAKLSCENLFIAEPLGYLEFNFLVKNAMCVITDSGGITEETSVMGIPCITLRDNTERPETCTIGTNELIGTDPAAIKPAIEKLLSGKWKKGRIPELWDGEAAKRIVNVLTNMKP